MGKQEEIRGKGSLTPAGAPVARNSGRLGVGWGEGSPGHWLEWGDSLEGQGSLAAPLYSMLVLASLCPVCACNHLYCALLHTEERL